MLVDSHCHLNMLDISVDDAIDQAKKNDVEKFLCVSVDYETIPEIISIIDQHESVFGSIGVHPNEQQGYDPSVDELVHLASHKKILALGETGLDYYRVEGDLKWQHDRFRRHIQAGIQVNKPVIVHTRDAAEDTIRILKEEQADRIRGVMHCFTGTLETAHQAIDLGFYISFSGIITFKNAESLREVVKALPLESILIETDCPYLAPVPFRGKSNQPAYVKYVAECVAELKNISYQQVAEVTTKNFEQLFQA